MKSHIAVARRTSSSENFETQSGTTLYSVLRSPILLRYPLLNFGLDDLIMIQTAYAIYQNAKLVYDVKQVSSIFTLRMKALILCHLSVEQLRFTIVAHVLDHNCDFVSAHQ